MTDKAILLGILLIVIVYFAYKKYKEGFIGETQMNGNLQYNLASSKASIENFIGDKQMNGNLQWNLASGKSTYENFDNYQGGYSSGDARFDESGAGQYTEYLRDSVDPGLNRRQKQFVTDLNRGDYSKATASIVNTAKYELRESQAADFIGLRAPRAVPIDYNQKQVPELTMDSGYAQADAIFGARVLNGPGGYV